MNHSSHTKLILAAVIGFVVLVAFGVPVLALLPLLAILAVCSLMMMFMMRGMDHGGDSNRQEDGADRTTTGHRH